MLIQSESKNVATKEWPNLQLRHGEASIALATLYENPYTFFSLIISEVVFLIKKSPHF